MTTTARPTARTRTGGDLPVGCPGRPLSHRFRQATLTTTFRDLGVIPEIADALETEGITQPFPIQEMALPLALAGQDVIGQARTGTGKTYAFGVAMLQLVGKPRKNRKKPRGLVLVPTRELALQVTEDLVLAAGKLGSRILTVYGGRAYEPQIEALKNGVDVIVGTPGRLLDLIKQKHLDLGQVDMLVLDEADRMLDLGFLPDIERIIKLVPQKRQTMLFSATMPGEIVTLSRRYLTRPTHVRAQNSDAEAETLPLTTQFVYRTHRMDKIEILARLLQSTGSGLTMVFCETKRACDMVSEQLRDKGFAAAAVHGDLGQSQREQALRAFRNGKINVLVATDVAARGIDIDDVTHVVNYDCPQDEKHYVHRIGRTGRAGRTGVAVTFVEWTELTRWKVINNALDLDFADPAESYSSSPHVYTDLGIPEGTKGVLPRANRSRAGLDAEALEDLGETGRVRSRDRSDRGGRGDRPDRADHGDREERRERPTRTRERRRTRAGRAQEAGTATVAEAATASMNEAGTGNAPAAEAATVSMNGSGTANAPLNETGTATAPVAEAATASTSTPAYVVDGLPPASEAATGRRSRRGANTAALTGALADVTPAQPEADSTPSQPVVERKPARRRTRATAVESPETANQRATEPATEPAAEPATEPATDATGLTGPAGASLAQASTTQAPAKASTTQAGTASTASMASTTQGGTASMASTAQGGTVETGTVDTGRVRTGRSFVDETPVDEPASRPVRRPEPERIIPASPFTVVFQSPDLATEDDDPAPSAATERAQQRRRPGGPRPRRTG